MHILQELQDLQVKRDHCQVREVSGQQRGEEQGTSEGVSKELLSLTSTEVQSCFLFLCFEGTEGQFLLTKQIQTLDD